MRCIKMLEAVPSVAIQAGDILELNERGALLGRWLTPAQVEEAIKALHREVRPSVSADTSSSQG